MKKILNSKKMLAVLTFSLSFSSLISCENNTNEETYEVTDLLNRKVQVPKKVENVLCIGASALRLYSYVGDMDKLCAVERYEVNEENKLPVRPYSYAYKNLFKTLPSINSGGPMQPANPEAILEANPDVIFSLYDNKENMNNLEKTTGIPVVCLSYGQSDPFSQDVYTSLDLIGKIINNEERSDFVINYIKSIKEDLNNRTKDIEESKKPSVYLGYNTYNGGKGTIGDTLVNYTCFKETNGNHVLKNITNLPNNNPTLELEKLIELNPSLMFIDVMNINNLIADYKNESMKVNLMQIDAFKNNNIYIQMPFNQYYTNIDIAIADSYFIGKTMFEDKFNDIDVSNKYNEILSTLLNKELNYYELTLQDTKYGFQKFDLNEIK